jgi:hypothetical protein
VRDANTIFKINGISVFTPKTKYKQEIKNVQNVEEEQDENSCCVIPQIPCFAKFFAIAM